MPTYLSYQNSKLKTRKWMATMGKTETYQLRHADHVLPEFLQAQVVTFAFRKHWLAAMECECWLPTMSRLASFSQSASC